MPKLGCWGKVAIGAVVAIVLLVVGIIWFPVPQPHVSLSAESIPHGHEWFFTNTLLASIIVIVILGLIVSLGMRKAKLVPKGLQSFVEYVFDWLYGLCTDAAGEENGRRFFPIVATIFLYVITAAFLSLIPFFETIGWGHTESYSGAFMGSATGFVVHTPLLRKANTDINFPLALALVSFVCCEYWGIRAFGFHYITDNFLKFKQLGEGIGLLFKGKAGAGLMGIFMGFIDIIVGILEIVSHFIRIVSFTFRLFGNMFAGMILLSLIAYLIPWILGVPFYGLEALFGFVQALIFGGLTLGFATAAVMSHE